MRTIFARVGRDAGVAAKLRICTHRRGAVSGGLVGRRIGEGGGDQIGTEAMHSRRVGSARREKGMRLPAALNRLERWRARYGCGDDGKRG